jgi:hypothetical protein
MTASLKRELPMGKCESHLTARQQQWMASLRDGLQRDTGRSFEDWVALARTCPETAPRARVQWMKAEHGLGQNRALMVLGEAFPAEARHRDPEALRAALWSDPASRGVFEAIQAAVLELGEVTEGPRKGYTAWSRSVQFAAAKPARGGAALLGLAVPPGASSRLEPAGRDGWSERLISRLRLRTASEMDEDVRNLLQRAFESA